MALGTLCIAIPCLGQVCEGDFALLSQADVDAFDCTEVTSNLLISGDDITDLGSLSSLTAIGGTHC